MGYALTKEYIAELWTRRGKRISRSLGAAVAFFAGFLPG